LKRIFTDIRVNIWIGYILYANIFCSSIDNITCTPSDRQMYPWGYMYPRLGTPGLTQRTLLKLKDQF